MKYNTCFIFLIAMSGIVISSHTILMAENSYGQVISNGLEESDLYLQISQILEKTETKLGELTQTINSGETENALEIVSNITLNIKEVREGVNLLVDNPIHGGD
ncbi:MAG: hypothetical protein ACE5SW_10965 [Nitrososphaeraceae archaeon]